MLANYVFDSHIEPAANTALKNAKDSGEFDGKDGVTPEAGQDYFTEAERNTFLNTIISRLTTANIDGNLEAY